MWHRHIHRTYIVDGIYFVTTYIRFRSEFFGDPGVAKIVEESIWWKRHAQNIVYAYVIMPDHLHLLIQPKTRNISEVMRSIKTNSSREINRHLHNAGRATRVMEELDDAATRVMEKPDECATRVMDCGRFSWQEKFYDHVITDDQDFRNHIEYIRLNPVKAGLVSQPEEYPFLYVNQRAMESIFGV